MHQTTRSLVPLLLFCLSTAGPLVSGCDAYRCDEDQIDRDTACEQVTETADQILESCGLPPFSEVLCEINCISLDGIECIDEERVRACQAAILGLRCERLNVQTIQALPDCVRVFNRMEEACADSSADDDDDDWDDWD